MASYSTIKKKIYDRDNNVCFYCGKKIENETAESSSQGTIDHVFPKHFGGTNRKGNLVCCCLECNNLKGILPPFFFLKHREEIKEAVEVEREIFLVDKLEFHLIKP